MSRLKKNRSIIIFTLVFSFLVGSFCSASTLNFNQQLISTDYHYSSSTLASSTSYVTDNTLNTYYIIFKYLLCAYIVISIANYRYGSAR